MYLELNLSAIVEQTLDFTSLCLSFYVIVYHSMFVLFVKSIGVAYLLAIMY